jgi:hypothetical protein
MSAPATQSDGRRRTADPSRSWFIRAQG